MALVPWYRRLQIIRFRESLADTLATSSKTRGQPASTVAPSPQLAPTPKASFSLKKRHSKVSQKIWFRHNITITRRRGKGIDKITLMVLLGTRMIHRLSRWSRGRRKGRSRGRIGRRCRCRRTQVRGKILWTKPRHLNSILLTCFRKRLVQPIRSKWANSYTRNLGIWLTTIRFWTRKRKAVHQSSITTQWT